MGRRHRAAPAPLSQSESSRNIAPELGGLATAPPPNIMSGKWLRPAGPLHRRARQKKTRGREKGRLRLGFAMKGKSWGGRHIRLTCEMGRFEWTTPDSANDGGMEAPPVSFSLGPDEAPERHRRCTSLHPLTHSMARRQISLPSSAFDVLRAALKPIVHSMRRRRTAARRRWSDGRHRSSSADSM